MTTPQERTTAWSFIRDKVLPSVAAVAMTGTFVTGFAMWKELAVISVKLDHQQERDSDQDRAIGDHEARLRSLEKSRP